MKEAGEAGVLKSMGLQKRSHMISDGTTTILGRWEMLTRGARVGKTPLNISLSFTIDFVLLAFGNTRLRLQNSTGFENSKQQLHKVIKSWGY